MHYISAFEVFLNFR